MGTNNFFKGKCNRIFILLNIFLVCLVCMPKTMAYESATSLTTKKFWNISDWTYTKNISSYAVQATVAETEALTLDNQWDISINQNESVIATLSEDGTLTITGTGRMKDWTNFNETPWGIDSIRTTVKKVIIGNGVINIGNQAFSNGTKITNVTLSQTVKNIGNSAFFNCASLASLEIPNGVINIDNSAFESCKNLITVHIPASVETIGTNAFTDLTAITVDSANQHYCDEDGILFNKEKTKLILFPSEKQEAIYTIPKGVTMIDDYAFWWCDNLVNIIVPSSVTTIGDSAFGYCKKLTDIIIPSSVRTMGTSVFENHNSDLVIITNDASSTAGSYAVTAKINTQADELWDITVEGNESVIAVLTSDGNGILKIYGTGVMKDWANYDETPWGNNRNRENVKKVIVGKGITNIGKQAFSNGVNIASVTLSETVTNIGDSAFFNCKKLTSIELPEKIIRIGNSAFEACTDIKQIRIPASVKTIGDSAFYAMRGLTDITVASENTNYSDENGVLLNKNKTKLLIFPIGKQVTNYTIPASVTSIENKAFSSCSQLTSIEISSKVTDIGDEVFNWHNENLIIIADSEQSSIVQYAKTNNIKYEIKVTEITVSPQTATIKEGGTKSFTAIITPADATNKKVEWSSSDSNIATVTSAGIVTGKKEGEVTITATSLADSSKKATATIKVEKEVIPDDKEDKKPTIDSAETISKDGKEYIVIIVTDEASEIVSVEVKKGDKTYKVEKDEEGRYYFEPDEDGEYIITVTNDKGNTSQTSIIYKKEDQEEDDPKGDQDNKGDNNSDGIDKDNSNHKETSNNKTQIKGQDKTMTQTTIPKAGIFGICIQIMIVISIIILVVIAIKVRKYKNI